MNLLTEIARTLEVFSSSVTISSFLLFSKFSRLQKLHLKISFVWNSAILSSLSKIFIEFLKHFVKQACNLTFIQMKVSLRLKDKWNVAEMLETNARCWHMLPACCDRGMNCRCAEMNWTLDSRGSCYVLWSWAKCQPAGLWYFVVMVKLNSIDFIFYSGIGCIFMLLG